MYDAFCKWMSAHEAKCRFNGNKNHGTDAHTMYTVAFQHFLTENEKKKKHENTKTHSQTKNIPQVHSSAQQNLSYNFETLHHDRAVKSSIVVIFQGYQIYSRGTLNDKAIYVRTEEDTQRIPLLQDLT